MRGWTAVCKSKALELVFAYDFPVGSRSQGVGFGDGEVRTRTCVQPEIWIETSEEHSDDKTGHVVNRNKIKIKKKV